MSGKKLIFNNKGQVLLIVVLTMIVALTVGLSIASRTITNLKISKQNEESQRAFSAAEAGVEKVKQTGTTTSSTFQNNADFTATVVLQQGIELLINAGDIVDQDVGIDVWLSTYPTYASQINGTITLYWNTSDQVNCAAGQPDIKSGLEVIMLTGTQLSPVISKYIYDDANICNRIPGSDTVITAGSPYVIDGISFQHSAQITVTNGLIMKVIPLYNSTKLAIRSSVALPPQGSVITSTGKSGDTARKIVYFSSYPQVPVEIFPYSLIAQ